MGAFFRGWKRKAGVATLAMACLFAALWMRGYTPAVILFASDDFVIRVDSDWLYFEDPMIVSLASGLTFEAPPASIMRIPHLVTVIPLTLLSACLLLSKPGPKPTTQVSHE